MFVKNNQISGRQAFRLLVFELLGYSALLTPAILAKTAGRDGIFSIVLMVVGGLIYLRLIRDMLTGGGEDYVSALTACFGSAAGNVIKVIYFIYFLLLAAKVTAVFSELVAEELLEKQFGLIAFLILLMVYYGVIGGIEGRARIYEILFWIVLIPLFLMMISASPGVDTDYWLPILFESPKGILSGSYHVCGYLSILFLVPFFSKYLSGNGQIYHCAKRALVWTGSILGTLYLILLGMFGKEALAVMDYPVVTMMSRIQMTGGFFKRADALMFGIWFFTLYALINSLVFFSGELWKIEKKKKYWWIVGELFLVYLLANSFYYTTIFRNTCESFFYYIGTPFIVSVPVIMQILMRKKTGCFEKAERTEDNEMQI